MAAWQTIGGKLSRAIRKVREEVGESRNGSGLVALRAPGKGAQGAWGGFPARRLSFPAKGRTARDRVAGFAPRPSPVEAGLHTGAGEPIDQAARLTVVVLLETGQRFLSAATMTLLFKQKDGQGSQQRKVASPPGVPDATAIFVLGAVAPVMLAVFDTPMKAGPVHDFFGRNLVFPQAGQDEGDAGGFLDDSAFAQVLDVLVDADQLSCTRQAHHLRIDRAVPQLPGFDPTVAFFSLDEQRGERLRRGAGGLWPARWAGCL